MYRRTAKTEEDENQRMLSLLPVSEVAISKEHHVFGARRKPFSRPPQAFAPPAANLSHGRGKLV
jgi:hypothetical protein